MKANFVQASLMTAAKIFVVALLGGSLAHSQAAISQLTIRPVAPVERDTIFVDVSFDAPICTPNQSTVAQVTSGPPATSVIQSRVDGKAIAVVIAARPAGSGCTLVSTVTVALPPLVPGAYTIRVADSALGFSGIVYGNNTIKTSTTTFFNVASDSPPVVNVYLDSHELATSLVVTDLGSYQYFPYYASDAGNWQPVFYAWANRTADSNSQFQPVYALALRISGIDTRNFYTIDPKERTALIATGAFVDLYVNSSAPSALFAAIAPVGGLCPVGRVSIYRAYEPKLMIHRFVPTATYRLMLANGWKGDGVAFCGAAEPSGASSWAPN